MATPSTIGRRQNIAERCGVTRRFVSMARRGVRKNVGAAATVRIRALAAEEGYNPVRSQAARRLQGPKSSGQSRPGLDGNSPDFGTP